MRTIEFVLYGDLPHLAGHPPCARHTCRLTEPGAVKDALEALGIPHTEVDLLLCDGEPARFSRQILGGERIEAFPTPSALEQGLTWPAHRLQPRPLARQRFLCDQHLGKLARLLRLLGFDTLCEPGWAEPELARCAVAEQRAVLSCSRALLKRKRISCGCLIRSREADTQAIQTIRRYGLAPLVHSFSRCSLCNGALEEVAPDDVRHRVPLRTWQWRERYLLCRHCGRIYWEGTHVARLRRRITAILEAAARGQG